MARTKIDWSHHTALFRASSQSVAAYCAAADLKVGTFQYHLCKKKKAKRRQTKAFTAFSVASELVISRDPRGTLTLSGFDVAQLAGIVGAWSNALSQ